jgi:hypothetical protein
MIARQITAMVETHCAALEAAANAMEAAGIGAMPVVGHADRLRRMAFDLRADAAKGIIPSRYEMQGVTEVSAASPEVIKAALERREVKQVAHLLRKHSIEITAVQSIVDFDSKLRAAACPLQDRLLLKSTLLHAGLLV